MTPTSNIKIKSTFTHFTSNWTVGIQQSSRAAYPSPDYPTNTSFCYVYEIELNNGLAKT